MLHERKEPTMTRVLGCDPGFTTATAAVVEYGGGDLLGENRLRAIAVINIPTIGVKSDEEIDVLEFERFIKAYNPDHAFVERVWAQSRFDPKTGTRVSMGVQTSFDFGGGLRAIRATIRLCRIPLTGVLPKEWQAHHKLSGSYADQHERKKASRARAIDLFPESSCFSRKKDAGRAESALIAVYGIHYLMRRATGAVNDNRAAAVGA
jgi:hypothetical protein